MSKPRSRRLAMLASAIAVPAIMVGFAAPASAAELTPIAEYLDETVAGLESDLGGALDSLGLEASD